MGNGYGQPIGDGMTALAESLRDINRRLREVETTRGSQIFETVKELRSVVDNLAATIAALSASGTTWYGPVSTSGTVNAAAGITSVGVYNLDVSTLAGSRRADYVHQSGAIGYAPSTIAKKMDLGEVPFTASDVLALAPVVFHYRAQVAIRDDPQHPSYDPTYQVPWDIGLIAEELIAHGLELFVFFEDDMQTPAGINYDIFAAVALLVVARDQQSQLDDLKQRLSEAGI